MSGSQSLINSILAEAQAKALSLNAVQSEPPRTANQPPPTRTRLPQSQGQRNRQTTGGSSSATPIFGTVGAQQQQLTAPRAPTQEQQPPPIVPQPAPQEQQPADNFNPSGRRVPIIDKYRLSADIERRAAENLVGNIQPWTDNVLKGQTTFQILRVPDADCVQLCDDMITALTQGVSERLVISIMRLAWNLYQVDGRVKVFPVINPCASLRPLEDTLFSSEMVVGGQGDPVPRLAGLNDHDYVMCGSYLAAAILRLFSKSTDSLAKAINEQLSTKYYRFYNKNYCLQNVVPDKDCLDGIKMVLTSRNEFKKALAGFLYSFHETSDAGKGLCRMLYEQHLRLTGMHAVSLFLRVTRHFQCTITFLACSLLHQTTCRGLEGLINIFKEFMFSNQDSQERQTWMYARVFDERYFYSVQTRQCKTLVCALAWICHQIGEGGNRNVMDIVHIASMDEHFKTTPKKWAERLIRYIMESEDAAQGNPITAA
ncbi:TPA_asm: nucleocapsid protein [Zea virus 1]|uniref:Nucleoprotein n=1 Tax=Zea virus 1 TaxID=2977999 RepID=A0A9N6YJI4_9RHAB|nr:TPA_asm: nucleocapsid protein [Zea virus 1]